MFGKKDKGGTATPERELDKTKNLSPRDEMITRLDALEVGKEMNFRLGEIYVKPYITIVRNASGKKFTAFQDSKDSNGMPAGKRGKFWDSDKAKDIVGWIVEREGKPYQG
jgi:hypothetical protein